MRIGMMVDAYKPYISGVTHFVDLNKRAIEKMGHEVFVFTFGDSESITDETRVVHSAGIPLQEKGWYLSLRYTREARKLLQSMDVIHVHHPFMSGRLALRYARPYQIPIIYTNHTRYDLYAQAYLPMMPEEISDGLLKVYMPSFCDAVDLVIAPSAGMEKVLRELGVQAEIAVVPNGVDLERFHKAKSLNRADFGFRPEDVVLIYVGRLGPEKNLPLLLRAFNGVAKAFDNVRLLILGDGPIRDEVSALASELGLSAGVRFEGMVPYDKLPGYLAMCDAFVTASVTEVHPLSVIEAMGAGLPILGIHSPGVGDTIEDGVTGFLTDEDPIAFAVKMTRLVTESDLRRKMGAAAYDASQEFAIERTSQLMLGHYQRMADSDRPERSDLANRTRDFLEQFNL